MISCKNEWGKLKKVVVGTIKGARWPLSDHQFQQELKTSLWTETTICDANIPEYIIEETEEDLSVLVDVLKRFDVEVLRPCPADYSVHQGMYSYCPRDRIIIAGDVAVDVNMSISLRNHEIDFLLPLLGTVQILTMPRFPDTFMDAANVCRLNDSWLFLESKSGSKKAYNWLCDTFPNIRIELCNFYAGVHIDSTISAVNDHTVLVNGSRVTKKNLPQTLRDWDIIWVDDCVAQDFYHYPYASKWMGMNTFSINPTTLVVDRNQTDLIRKLERKNFTVIPLILRHTRTLGGGFHCVTLDLVRE